MNWMAKWGGCTHSHGLVFKFTDGTRGFLVGRDGNVAPSPSEKALARSMLVTPEEFGQYQAAKKSQVHQRQIAELAQKKAQLLLESLELGES